MDKMAEIKILFQNPSVSLEYKIYSDEEYLKMEKEMFLNEELAYHNNMCLKDYSRMKLATPYIIYQLRKVIIDKEPKIRHWFNPLNYFEVKKDVYNTFYVHSEYA